MAPVPGALATETNLTFKAEATLKESFDSNVYLQDVEPDLAAVPRAVRPHQESLVTTFLPKLSLDYRPCEHFAAALSYTPEVAFYHAEPGENYAAHRGAANLSGQVADLKWMQPNAVTWIDGNDEGLYFGGPGGAPAIGGIPLRDRREAFVYRGGFNITKPLGEWFLRPVASAYVHDFFTDQRRDRGYENYVDRNDVNGGLDVGFAFVKGAHVTLGYRYGTQDEGELIIDPYQYDMEYHRVLFGIEGKPTSWLKLAVQLGPDFRSTTANPNPAFPEHHSAWWVDAVATITPTKQDSLTLSVKQYEQPAFASCSVYEDITYDLVWRHKFSPALTAAGGFRAYGGDWLAPVNREDWIFTPSAQLSYTFDKHWNAEFSYSYDWVDSIVPNMEGREFTRHIVSLGVRYTL